MKRLMQGKRLIGEYPDDWQPPKGCDIDIGLKNGSMSYTEAPEVIELPPPSLVDCLISQPDELKKLKAALGL